MAESLLNKTPFDRFISRTASLNLLHKSLTLDQVTMTAAASVLTYSKDWIIKNITITTQDDESTAVQNSPEIKF